MRRLLLSTCLLVALAIAAAPAAAAPGISVRYENELLRVTLDGSYAGSYYRVWRSGDVVGQQTPFGFEQTLCTGDCFITDLEATPGKTYYYRFDLLTPGGLVSYGPYAVTVPDTPVGVKVSPNPSRGEARIDFSVPGSSRRDAPVPADARILDLQGRTVRVLSSSALVRGVTSMEWDGRGDAGQQLGAGIYFVRLITPLGRSTTRIVRLR
jgi:hypothetical protein